MPTISVIAVHAPAISSAIQNMSFLGKRTRWHSLAFGRCISPCNLDGTPNQASGEFSYLSVMGDASEVDEFIRDVHNADGWWASCSMNYKRNYTETQRKMIDERRVGTAWEKYPY